jgi:hypothetical protein
MVLSDAQKRAMLNYQKRRRERDPEFREKCNIRASNILKQKYKEDESFRKKRLEYACLKYYYTDAEDKALMSIRRIL